MGSGGNEQKKGSIKQNDKNKMGKETKE